MNIWRCERTAVLLISFSLVNAWLSLVCARPSARVRGIFRSSAGDFLLVYVWLFDRIRVTFPSCSHDFKLAHVWLFVRACIGFCSRARYFPLVLQLIYSQYELNWDTFNFKTQVTWLGHIVFYIFWHLLPPSLWLVLNAGQKSVFLVWLLMVLSSK